MKYFLDELPRARSRGLGRQASLRPSTSGRTRDGSLPYRNRMPQEIVSIFEKHGFIWGGKWNHFDTMHFEYRPELLADGP
jgi:D-alanyl-D-alanine carboxypeptidase